MRWINLVNELQKHNWSIITHCCRYSTVSKSTILKVNKKYFIFTAYFVFGYVSTLWQSNHSKYLHRTTLIVQNLFFPLVECCNTEDIHWCNTHFFIFEIRTLILSNICLIELMRRFRHKSEQIIHYIFFFMLCFPKFYHVLKCLFFSIFSTIFRSDFTAK